MKIFVTDSDKFEQIIEWLNIYVGKTETRFFEFGNCSGDGWLIRSVYQKRNKISIWITDNEYAIMFALRWI